MKIIKKRKKNREEGEGTQKTDHQKVSKEAMNLRCNSNIKM